MERVFTDRIAAARVLADLLRHHRGQHPLVLAIPRGGVPMGRVIADALAGELDVVLVHKLGAPRNPEYAIGAIEESGRVTLNPDATALATRSQLREEARRQLALLRERRRLYSAGRPASDPEGRVVVVVDDGVATGSTLLAALHAIRHRRPARLVAAVGVAPSRTARRLRQVVDELACGREPVELSAVGMFFEDFPQVDDAEVVRLLRAEPPGPGSPARTPGPDRAGG